MSLNERERQIRQRLKDDFPHYAEKCLRIRTKAKKIQPLALNKAQLYIHDRLQKQLEEKGFVRALILKGRQQGCSTYTEGRFYWKVTHQRGAKAFILTHLDEATRNVFKMAKRFYDYCPPLVKPSTSASNARELAFDKLDSGYAVGTARTEGTGRSDTLQFFHGSEVAYWKNAGDHIAGVFQAVPKLPGTEIILESTSAGAQGLFYEMCMTAQRGEGDFELIFVPWFWQDEYRIAVKPDFELTADEKALKDQFGLDDEQIAWRRSKIVEFNFNVSQFKREYPCTVKEAFETEVAGALWTRATLAKNRVSHPQAPEMARIVVSIDPAASKKDTSDETGIIVAGLGVDGHGYIFEDHSGKYTPRGWALKAIGALDHHEGDRIVAETNNGGDMVETTLRTVDEDVPYRSVHASRGKRTRAEPVAALYERGLVHHVGVLETLENQMTSWDASDGSDSPDRIDATVWAIFELMLAKEIKGFTDDMLKSTQETAPTAFEGEMQW